jgi:hypothetical protein
VKLWQRREFRFWKNTEAHKALLTFGEYREARGGRPDYRENMFAICLPIPFWRKERDWARDTVDVGWMWPIIWFTKVEWTKRPKIYLGWHRVGVSSRTWREMEAEAEKEMRGEK